MVGSLLTVRVSPDGSAGRGSECGRRSRWGQLGQVLGALGMAAILGDCDKSTRLSGADVGSGGLIAFGIAAGHSNEQWVINPRTGARTRADGLSWGACWSADGRWLIGDLASRSTNGLRQWRPSDGSVEVLRFAGVPVDLYGVPVASPDGRYVVLADHRCLWLLDLKQERGEQLTLKGWDCAAEEWPPDAFDDSPVWSRAGDEIAFLRDNPEATRAGRPDCRLLAVRLPSGKERELARFATEILVLWTQAWSPDGRYLILEEDGPSAKTIPRSHIHDLHTGQTRPFLPKRGSGIRLAFSPSGDRVVYVSNRTGRYRLYLTSDLTQPGDLLSGSGGEDFNASWSPDGQSLVVIGRLGSQMDLWLQPARPGVPSRRLTDDEAVEQTPVWSPGVADEP